MFFGKGENKLDIQKDEFPQLDDIGIEEMYLCNKTNYFTEIHGIIPHGVPIPPNRVPNPPGPSWELNFPFITNDSFIITSLDYNCIESASILCHNVQNIHLMPLPHMSNNTNIKNIKDLDILKKKLGNYNPTNNVTTINNYCNTKTNNYLNMKNTTCDITWEKLNDKNIFSLSHFSYNSFKKNLNFMLLDGKNNIPIAIEEGYYPYPYYGIPVPNPVYVDDHREIPNSMNINNFIFVTDYEVIINILKECKKIKYKQDIDIVERSSIWEISLNIDFITDSGTGDVIQTKIIYDHFIKIYPTEHYCPSLIYNNGKYEYNYKGNKFILFNSLKDIPIDYIKKLIFRRYSTNQKKLINKILNKNNKNNFTISPIHNRKNNVKFENLK